jgi:hypothetical protein
MENVFALDVDHLEFTHFQVPEDLLLGHVHVDQVLFKDYHILLPLVGWETVHKSTIVEPILVGRLHQNVLNQTVHLLVLFQDVAFSIKNSWVPHSIFICFVLKD